MLIFKEVSSDKPYICMYVCRYYSISTIKTKESCRFELNILASAHCIVNCKSAPKFLLLYYVFLGVCRGLIGMGMEWVDRC